MLEKKHEITKKMFIDTLIVLVIAELTGSITCLIDGIITNRFLGNDAMAAFGYSGTYFSIVSIINGILMVGNQTLCVSAISKGNKEDVNKIMSLSTILGIASTSLITILMLLFSRQTGILFGAKASDEAIMNNFIPYIRGVCLGAPFWCASLILTPILQIDGDGKRAKIAALCNGATDVIFDLLLGVVFKWGTFGMGLATSFSHITGFIIITLHFFTKKSSYKFVFKNLCFNKILSLLKEGLPRAISMLSRTIGPILLNLIIIGIGTNNAMGLTALSVQRSVSYTIASFGWGVCGTALMLGTLFYNEKNVSELKTLTKYCIISITCVVGLLSVILVGVSPLITRLYQSDYKNNIELYNLTNIALRYYIISLPFIAFNVSFASYIQAVGKNILANVVNAFCECISLVIACLVLSITRKYVGFFEGFLYGQLGLSLVLVSYIIIHRLVYKKEKYSLYFIKNGYINENDKVLQASISSYDDIEELSIKAQNLCKDTRLTSSQSYKVGLCVEELASNVFEHGFKKDNKKHLVEMRIVVSQEEVIITLLDDCKKFDISKKLKSWEINKEHPEKNIGIRTIMLLSKKVIYSNTMNLNNLQIII